MTKEKKIQIFTDARNKWGEHSQLIVACEELAELIQAITKHLRFNDGKTVDYNLMEECADSLIVIDQIMYMFGMQEVVEDIYKQKMKRLEKTIKEAK